MEERQTAAPEEVSFASADGTSTIHASIWWPADPALRKRPLGVVQVVHGMSEHIGRYDEFARYLADAGFVVTGDDHIGHGRSAAPKRRGVMPAKNGNEVLVEDEHTLRGLVVGRVSPDTPYIFFGHSMGSFITRVYLAHHGEGISGAVICGTGFIPPATSKVGGALARMLARIKGEDYVSDVVDGMGAGAYAKAVPGPTDVEWLSYSRANIDRYLADELCGFKFSVGGYAALTALTAEACSPDCARRMPSELPLLYIAGDGDPVGDMGRGVRQSAKLAKDGGSTDVTVKVYEHMRHEILNEDDREKVMADVLGWIESHVLHIIKEEREDES